uniref:OmpA family protein n=1 Tax=Roseihalotalea indica TaxID=2867963 RepID=A0AA49JJ49_9BACT|nr:OmpA family protein [Tunicatimonas sp. TK19036]
MAGLRIIGLFLLAPRLLLAQVQVDTSFTEDVLIKEVFLQSALKVNAISYRGSYQALGLFTCEHPDFPLPKGIILSTGRATNAIGPNKSHGRSTIFRKEGDAQLSKISGARDTYDAAVLEFTFFPTHNTIAFDYVFASEEYPEYVNKGFNDVFAFILTDLETKEQQNLAVVPGTKSPVHIDQINAYRNAEWFIENTLKEAPYRQWIEYDGLTQMLTAQARVVPNRPYHIKLAIADVDDYKLDSSVILREKSFRSFDQPIANTPQAEPVMVYFPWDSSELSEQAKTELRTFVSQILKASPQAIRVRGHTDDQGTNDYNQQLARQRVQAVVNFLASLGLRGKVKLYRQSLGESEPVASNAEETGRARNRRVEVQVQF